MRTTSDLAHDSAQVRTVLVVTGDHSLGDPTKWDGRYMHEDLELHAQMRAALESLPGYEFEFLSEHGQLIERVTADSPDFVLNLCDTGFRNIATQELHLAMSSRTSIRLWICSTSATVSSRSSGGNVARSRS